LPRDPPDVLPLLDEAVTGTETNAFIVTTPSSVRGIAMVASDKIVAAGGGTDTSITPPSAIRHGAIV
jgi:hypothetical protein